MPNWTKEQLRAIEARGGSVLLSAAAGSGKTTVLVERVLRLVTGDGLDVDRMLIVTFTRAAASDMRAKLSRRLNERAAAGDARCREQLLKLEHASISTLHAFCADFLRTNFESAGVDPAFRVLDDAVDARLRDEALDEALEEAYAQGGEALSALDYGRGPGGVRAAAELLMARMEDRPDPAAWLERATRCDEEALRRWQDELKAAARRAIRTALVQLEQAAAIAGCPDHYAAAIRADAAALGDMLAIEDYDELYRALTGFAGARATGGRWGAPVDEAALETVKRLRDAARRAVNGTRLGQLPLLPARRDAAALGRELETLADIALRASALYEAAKAEQSGLTYADLEHRTLRALSRPDVAEAMRSRFDCVFVDEYQDTSDLQEALVRALSRGDNLFMVGDVKQSIYRFRHAEPGLFLQKYDAFSRGEGGALLPLTRNFRSRKGVLDFVNMVFERVMTGGDSEIVYDALARLNPGREDAGDGQDVEICLIDADGAPEAPEAPEDAAGDGEDAAELLAAEREGMLIAARIRDMMARDPKLKYRDFAILTRSKAGAFSAMMPALLAAGIPAYADGQAGYYESVEISWLISMLRLLDNGRSDVALIAMLHSPAVGMTAEELALVRAAHRRMAFVDAAAAYAREADDAIADKLRRFEARMDAWRLRLGGMGLGEFVRLILDESGFYTYAGALPGGAQRQANLDQFVVDAARFDDEYSGSLTRFLAYTEYLRQKGDGDAAHLLGENDNVVRMMSVHKSKGLEFSVVFGAQLARRYHAEKSSAPLVSHPALGVGMSYFDPQLRTRRLSLQQAAVMERQRREDAAEEMRILYVLLTRARERLVLVGTVRDAEKAQRRWEALAAAPFAAQSHLDLVMAARCGALAAGEPACSGFEIVPAASVRARLSDRDAEARAAFEDIMAAPERYADAELQAQLAWKYPDALSARKPLKLTASGLLRELEGPEALPALLERPAFLAGAARRMTGAERGTAYHRAMQLLSIDALDGLSGRALTGAVERQLDDFANRLLMDDAQRQAVQGWRLARFLESDVGLRLRRAGTVRREWPFNAMLSADEALTEEEAGRFGGGELLVQGTIDCCFVEDGQWVLLDYKTDRTDDMDALRAHYARQLGVYALALQSITGMRVGQRLLCLLESGGTVEV
ncbi:MAG: UvrD-helicase domain-containing protein [Clostridia bacterium]|nr:UvrD-helicase domain-containing protein [Clostridia bacterium]